MNTSQPSSARTLAVALLDLAAAWTASASELARAADRPPSKEAIAFVAFSSDSREYCLKVTDENLGTLFQIRDSKKNTLVKNYPFPEEDEKKVWRQVKKAHSLDQEPVEDQENPKNGVTLMTKVKGDKIQILMMKGDQIAPYDAIELLKTKKGEPAKATVKQVVWDQSGKYAVLVYHQKLTDLLPWEGDFASSFKFRSYRVSFGDPAEKDDE